MTTDKDELHSPMSAAKYAAWRAPYTPQHATTIFVLESPPTTGNYFYRPDGSTKETLFSAIMEVLGETPATKHEGLTAFQQRKMLLLDVTYTPVDDVDEGPMRDAAMMRDYDDLVVELRRRHTGARLVLVKKNVCKLNGRLTMDGFNVLNRGLMVPFPFRKWYPVFVSKVRDLLASGAP
jgi:hypothetical protein